jgi:hypothetical protein
MLIQFQKGSFFVLILGKQDIKKVHEVIQQFTAICVELGVKQVEANSFIQIEKNMINRLTRDVPANVMVARLTK